MIGNDLVDLEQAGIESNRTRRGYLDKIYTPSEQKLITESVDPDQIVWLLWSMKEAAYKIYSRQTGTRKYAPISLACSHLDYSNEDFVQGRVTVDELCFFTKSILKKGYIHTLAASSLSQLSDIKEVIYQCPPSQMDYRSTFPKCVSHHGKYLALIY